MAILYVVSGIAIVVIVVKGLMSRSDPTQAYSFKPRVWLDAKTLERYDIEIDFNNPTKVVRNHPETGKKVVPRAKKFFDKGPVDLPLTNYWHRERDGMEIFIENVDEITMDMATKLIEEEKKNKQLQNKLALHISRVAELENKVEALIGERMDQMGEFNKKLPFFPSKK